MPFSSVTDAKDTYDRAVSDKNHFGLSQKFGSDLGLVEAAAPRPQYLLPLDGHLEHADGPYDEEHGRDALGEDARVRYLGGDLQL